MSGARLGLIGARRERQGLGPFVARDLHREGAELVCLLGTSDATVDAARSDLADRLGVELRGYTSLDLMLARERLDALAILSPSASHETYLRGALEAGLHVLCEKPLVWGVPDLAGLGQELVEAFDAQGLLLVENCQWPYTLPAFRELHGADATRAPERFEMELAPASSGAERIGDAMPHPLSLLQALAPDAAPHLDKLRTEPEASGITIEFDYCAGGTRVAARVRLRRSAELPRPAALAIDGRWARRVVREPGYCLYFGSGDREVEVRDPLQALIAAFVAELRAVLGGRRPDRATGVGSRLHMLEQVLGAFEGDSLGPRHS